MDITAFIVIIACYSAYTNSKTTITVLLLRTCHSLLGDESLFKKFEAKHHYE